MAGARLLEEEVFSSTSPIYFCPNLIRLKCVVLSDDVFNQDARVCLLVVPQEHGHLREAWRMYEGDPAPKLTPDPSPTDLPLLLFRQVGFL